MINRISVIFLSVVLILTLSSYIFASSYDGLWKQIIDGMTVQEVDNLLSQNRVKLVKEVDGKISTIKYWRNDADLASKDPYRYLVPFGEVYVVFFDEAGFAEDKKAELVSEEIYLKTVSEFSK